MPNYVQQNGTQSTFPRNGPQISSVYSHAAIGDYVPMSTLPPALAAVSINPPAFEVAAVAEAVARQFGLQGNFEPLVSERDQNFRLHADDGSRYVVKVIGAAEDDATTAFEIGLLRQLQQADDVIAPAVIPTVHSEGSGEISSSDARHRLRVVTWVDGEPLETGLLDPTTCGQFGAALARLGTALRGYSHPGENRLLAWDLQRVCELSGFGDHIDDVETRTAVSRAIDDYASRVLPVKPTLPSQVIHGDANPDNVLATGNGIAFIDFGDSIKAPRIFDLAIAAAYLRPGSDDPTGLIAPFVAGYHSAARLEARELELLFDLIRARLATTITMLYWGLSEREDGDLYRQKSLEQEGGAGRFLDLLDDLGRHEFRQKLINIQ